MKLVMDAMLVTGLIFLPGLFYCHLYVKPYTALDIIEGIIASIFAIGGAVSIAKALSVGGKGGPV